MAVSLGLVRGTLSSPCTTSMVVQNTAEPMQGEGLKDLASLTRKQQRTVKFLFLKASRPLLKQSNSASRQTAQASDTAALSKPVEEPVPAMKTPPGMDPLPLHALQAYEEARRAQQYETGTKGANPLDWMLDIAQTVSLPQYDWPPVLGWLKESENLEQLQEANEGCLDMPVEAFLEAPDEEDVAESLPVETEEDDVADIVYARCKWPRGTNSVSQAVAFTSTSASPSHAFPRCMWPRDTSLAQATPTSTSSVSFSTSLNTPSPASTSTPASTYPRCAWPWNSASTVSPLSEEEAGAPTQEDRDSLERIFASEPNVGVPHCAWPRKAGVSGQTASQEIPAGPHCAWPRKRALSVSGPVSAPLAKGHMQIPAPRCSWPKGNQAAGNGAPFVTAPVSSPLAEGHEQIMGPRCSWPRK